MPCSMMISQSTLSQSLPGNVAGYFQGFLTSRKIKNIGQHAANINDMTDDKIFEKLPILQLQVKI